MATKIGKVEKAEHWVPKVPDPQLQVDFSDAPHYKLLDEMSRDELIRILSEHSYMSDLWEGVIEQRNAEHQRVAELTPWLTFGTDIVKRINEGLPYADIILRMCDYARARGRDGK